MTSPRTVRLSLIARSVGLVLDGPRAEKRSGQRVNALLEENLDVVYRYAMRLTRNPETAQDLTQETMLRACSQLRVLRDPGAARVWLLRIATNLWTDWLRRDTHRPRLLKQDAPSGKATVMKMLTQRESVARALAALDELPPRQRQVVHLITIEQMTHHEVAEILGITLAAVKASLSAGRKELRRRLSDVYEELCGGTRCPASE